MDTTTLAGQSALSSTTLLLQLQAQDSLTTLRQRRSIGRLDTNNVSNDFIAYLDDVENYQKISSYTGGGNTPVTVTTGFRPQWLLIKADIAGEDWVIMDDARSKVMPATDAFFANTLGVQSNSAYNTYFLDDGFRVHNNNPRFNTAGATYFYMAIGGSKVTDPKDSVYEVCRSIKQS